MFKTELVKQIATKFQHCKETVFRLILCLRKRAKSFIETAVY